MSNPYREPSIDAFYQVSVHLAKQFERRFLEIDQLEKRIAFGSQEASMEGPLLKVFIPF
jgi:hypothetical protein